MRLNSKRFQVGDFAAYKAWFADPELERRLGPLDDEWLAAVLSEHAVDGATWLILDGETPVAVVETSLHPENESLAAVTGLAVKPELRGQGIGTAVLQEVLTSHRREERLEHLAYISEDNRTARRCFERSGFVPVTLTPNEEGFLARNPASFAARTQLCYPAAGGPHETRPALRRHARRCCGSPV